MMDTMTELDLAFLCELVRVLECGEDSEEVRIGDALQPAGVGQRALQQRGGE